MNTDNQKTQIIVVVALSAVLIGYLGYLFVGKSTKAASPAPTVEKKHQLPLATGNTPAPVNTETVVAASAPVDPFAPKIDLSDHLDMPNSTKSSNPMSGIKIKPLPSSFTGQGVGPAQLNITPMPSNPMADLTVSGIIEGETNLAIVHSGKADKYFVKEGQVIDGKYIVKSISRAGVLVTYGSRRFLLPITRTAVVSKSGGMGSS